MRERERERERDRDRDRERERESRAEQSETQKICWISKRLMQRHPIFRVQISVRE